MANEAIVEVRKPTIFKIMDLTALTTPGSAHTRKAVGRARSMEVYMKLSNPTAAPTATLTLYAVRPEAPATDPVDAADKEALTQTVVQAGAGTKREAYGEGETDATLPDDVEFDVVMSGAGADADVEIWIVLHY